MNTKHTPAPWGIHKWESQNHKGIEIKNIDLVDICTLSQTNHEANSKLIAAAPELLEVLQDIKHHCNFHGVHFTQAINLKIDIAIKKATV